MIHLTLQRKKRFGGVLFVLLMAMLNAACAAPAAPAAVPAYAPATEATGIATTGSYSTQNAGIIIASSVKLDIQDVQEPWTSQTLSWDDGELSIFGPIPTIPPATEMPASSINLDPFYLPSDLGPSKDAFGLVLPMLISGYSPIVCLEENGQSYLFIDKPAVTEQFGDLLLLPEYKGLASLVATCGNVVGGGGEEERCEKCGCVGPMSGPRCGFNASQLEASIQFIKLSSLGE